MTMSPGSRPSPSLVSQGHENPTITSTRPIATSHRIIGCHHPLKCLSLERSFNAPPPAAGLPFCARPPLELELEREKLEQVIARCVDWIPPGSASNQVRHRERIPIDC